MPDTPRDFLEAVPPTLNHDSSPPDSQVGNHPTAACSTQIFNGWNSYETAEMGGTRSRPAIFNLLWRVFHPTTN